MNILENSTTSKTKYTWLKLQGNIFFDSEFEIFSLYRSERNKFVDNIY